MLIRDELLLCVLPEYALLGGKVVQEKGVRCMITREEVLLYVECIIYGL